jgi:hypothetical protein
MPQSSESNKSVVIAALDPAIHAAPPIVVPDPTLSGAPALHPSRFEGSTSADDFVQTSA